MSIDLNLARENMIKQQIRPWEVLDQRVLDCFAAVPRDHYVPEAYRAVAYSDVSIPLGEGEHMMKPVVEGRMLQALELTGSENVLEIGTGSGFITACLARLSHEVTSLDIHADFTERARARLQADGYVNVRLETADALSWQPGRQFDAIAVTAAVAENPERFVEWLRPGGRLFVVHGLSPVQEALLLTREGEGLLRESLFETDIPYLRGAEPAPRFVL